MRASSLDMAMACPESQREPMFQQPVGRAALVGSAVHAYLEDYISGQPQTYDHYASEWALSEREDFAKIAYNGVRCWNALAQHFPNPICERELTDAGTVGLTGHPDVVSIIGKEARVLDWKTGRVEGDHTEQLRAYAYLICKTFDVDTVRAVVCDVRYQDIRKPVTFTRAELAEWYQQVARRLREQGYATGSHCQYCPRAIECPAKQMLLRTIGNAVIQSDSIIANLDDEKLIRLHDAIGVLEKALTKAKDALRAEVAGRGGRITTPDGNGLELRQEAYRTLQPQQAMETLLDRYGSTAWNAANVSLSSVKDTCGKDAVKLVEDAVLWNERSVLRRQRDLKGIE